MVISTPKRMAISRMFSHQFDHPDRKLVLVDDGKNLKFINHEPFEDLVFGLLLDNDDCSPSKSPSALTESLLVDIIQSAGRGSMSIK